MKSLLLMVMWITSTAEGTLYFQQIGTLNPSPAFGHIHFVIDTNIIMNRMVSLKETVVQVREVVKTHSHPSVQHRADLFLKKSFLDIESIIAEFKDIQLIIGSTTSDKSRIKRFLELLLEIGSLSISLFNQAEILHLQGSVSDVIARQKHIVDILQEHEVTIHDLKHDVLTIRDGFTSLANIVSETHAYSLIHDAEINIVMALAELRRSLVCVQGGIQTLLNHRVPLCFLSSKQIGTSMHNLAEKAAAFNLHILNEELAAFLQYETSILMSQGKIHVFTHVPLVNKQSLLDLLRFNHAPVQLADNLALQLAPAATILAIGRNNVHATFTEDEFGHLHRYQDYFFGDSSIILNNHINKTCLGAIYSQHVDKLRDLCPVRFIQTAESFYRVAPNDFVFYTNTPQTIQVTCNNNQVKHVAVVHTEKIRLEANCQVITSEHKIQTSQDFNSEPIIHEWPQQWNLSHILLDLDPSVLSAQAQELHLYTRAPTTARDLRKLLLSTHGATGMWWATAILILTTAIFLGILGYLGYRYLMIRKAQKASINTGDQS